MTIFFISSILFLGAILAGFLGSLSGLGGGLIIIPLLVLGFGTDIHYAIGTSLIAVIATSTATSCAYVKEGYSNIRVGILLETATTVGALFGVVLGSVLSASALKLTFGLFLIYTAINSLTNNSTAHSIPNNDKMAAWLNLNGEYSDKGGIHSYNVHYVPWSYLIMIFAGGLSGLLGLGSGVLKVVALDKVMGLPFKVSTTTSNFMIGVTAATSAGIYLKLGYIDPVLTMPVILGVTLGSLLGARLLPHINTKVLRQLFIILICIIAGQMILGSLK